MFAVNPVIRCSPKVLRPSTSTQTDLGANDVSSFEDTCKLLGAGELGSSNVSALITFSFLLSETQPTRDSSSLFAPALTRTFLRSFPSNPSLLVCRNAKPSSPLGDFLSDSACRDVRIRASACSLGSRSRSCSSLGVSRGLGNSTVWALTCISWPRSASFVPESTNDVSLRYRSLSPERNMKLPGRQDSLLFLILRCGSESDKSLNDSQDELHCKVRTL